jgi:hypothetical protein
MKNAWLYAKLHEKGLISDSSFERINQYQSKNLISVHFDLKTILYLGVTLLSAGLGILVYKNIDTIGHQVILAFIALVSAGGFVYCFKTSKPFGWGKVESPNVLFDFVLLLACLMMITFLAYLQYQYNVFGNRYGIASFIPMVILFFTAYYFDHLGILSMAITNFAGWLGITITPLRLWQSNDFNSSRVILTGIGIGVLLLLVAGFTKSKKFKPHFELTYNNFGTHALFVSLLAALFHFDSVYLLWFLVLAAFAAYSYFKSVRENSFYFLVFTVLYFYVAVSYLVIQLLTYSHADIAAIYLGIIYFMASAFWLVAFLMRTNKKLKANDSL